MKKVFSIVLALVMVLSIGSMAAFAEEGHVHDENCGCASPAVVCSHSQYSSSIEFTRYIILDAAKHRVVISEDRVCRTCGAAFNVQLSTRVENHRYDVYVRTDENTESGETTYYYDVNCKCGRFGHQCISDVPLD